MRKVNLLRCDVARDASMQDACVYEINAELSRYDYLLRQIKERSGEAVYKTCSEGVAKWG